MCDSTDDMTMRRARPEDAPRCGDIAVAAWQPVFASFRRMLGEQLFSRMHTNWQQRKRGEVEGHIRNHPDLAIVAELDGKIVAFLTFRLIQDKGCGEIGNNAVDPDFQGLGVGTMQCERAIEIFKQSGMEYAMVYTGLDEGHAPARTMYQKAGFDRSTPHIRYYTSLA